MSLLLLELNVVMAKGKGELNKYMPIIAVTHQRLPVCPNPSDPRPRYRRCFHNSSSWATKKLSWKSALVASSSSSPAADRWGGWDGKSIILWMLPYQIQRNSPFFFCSFLTDFLAINRVNCNYVKSPRLIRFCQSCLFVDIRSPFIFS